MAIDVFEVDKAGCDIFNRDYSIAIVKNNQTVYGYSIPQLTKDFLKKDFNRGLLSIRNKLRFKIRFHTASIILLFKEAIKRRNKVDSCKILICDDISGHLHEIKDMLFCNLRLEMPTLEKENIIRTKFSKESLINKAAKAFYKKDSNEICKYNSFNFKIEDLKKLIRKR